MLSFGLLDVGAIDQLGMVVDCLVLWEETVDRFKQVIDRCSRVYQPIQLCLYFTSFIDVNVMLGLFALLGGHMLWMLGHGHVRMIRVVHEHCIVCVLLCG